MAMFPDADASVLGMGGLDLLPIDRMAMMRARRPIQNRSLMSRNPLYGEVMPPGMPDMYPVGAGEFLQSEAGPQTGALGAPAQRMATTRVKKIFGVPVPERRARTFLGGLAAMPQITPGGGFGNFLSGLQGGLKGSMQAGDMFDQRQAEGEQAQVDNAYKQAMIDKMRAPEATPDGRTSQQKNYEALIALGVDPEKARFSAFGAEGPSQAGGSEFDRYLTMDDKTRSMYKEFKNIGDAEPADPDAGLSLSQEALENAALAYAKTGQLPAMGMGKAGAAVRTAILNKAGEKYPGLDIVGNKAETDSRRASLTNVQKIYDAASAWEETATRNSDVMLEAIKGIPDTGTRLGNKVSRYMASQLGDPKVAAFNAARETIKVEYARLLSSPGVGNAVLSDQARKEVEGLIAGDYTKPQMIRAINILRRDAKNRKAAYEAQINKVRDQVRWGEWGQNSYQGGSGRDVEWIMDASGNLVPK